MQLKVRSCCSVRQCLHTNDLLNINPQVHTISNEARLKDLQASSTLSQGKMFFINYIVSAVLFCRLLPQVSGLSITHGVRHKIGLQNAALRLVHGVRSLILLPTQTPTISKPLFQMCLSSLFSLLSSLP